MSEIKEVSILLNDLEDCRQILHACQNYFLGRDMQEAQAQLRAYSKSPLTAEIERVKERMDGYLGDFLLQQYEEEHGVIPEDEEESVEEEEPEEEVVEELSDNPLGTVKVQRQKGRRLTKQELEGEPTDE